MIGDFEKYHIRSLLSKSHRLDGRGPVEYRDVSVEYDVVETAMGSARVKIGDTEVVAGIKLSPTQPYEDSPDEGTLMVNAELLPLSSEAYEMGPPRFKAIELARVVDRGIREGHAIDVKKLVLDDGRVWQVSVDIISINDAGNLFDACGLAALAALKNCRFPVVNGDEIDYKKKSDKGLPLVNEPITITVLRIGDYYIADPCAEEEFSLDDRLTIAVMQDGRLCALQKGGGCSLNLEDVEQMVDIAIMKSEELRKHL